MSLSAEEQLAVEVAITEPNVTAAMEAAKVFTTFTSHYKQKVYTYISAAAPTVLHWSVPWRSRTNNCYYLLDDCVGVLTRLLQRTKAESR
jgi:hypothetical protein